MDEAKGNIPTFLPNGSNPQKWGIPIDSDKWEEPRNLAKDNGSIKL